MKMKVTKREQILHDMKNSKETINNIMLLVATTEGDETHVEELKEELRELYITLGDWVAAGECADSTLNSVLHEENFLKKNRR